MFTKNIIFRNFLGKKNKKQKIILNKFFRNQNLLKQYPLLKSLTKNYKYSYRKKNIKNLQKFSSFNLVGMGGSILGTEAIYDFLNHKVKKNFHFLIIYNTKKFQSQNIKKLI